MPGRNFLIVFTTLQSAIPDTWLMVPAHTLSLNGLTAKSVIISNGCAVEYVLLLIPAGDRERAQACEGMADSCVNPSSPASRVFSPSTH